MKIKDILTKAFPAAWWRSATGIWVASCFGTLMVFNIMWCSITTFRAMSDWLLYACNALGALLLALPFVVTRSNLVQLIFMLVVDGVLISNLMYCRTYYSAIPADSYLLVGNLADFKASVVDSMRWYDILLFVITLATGLIVRKRQSVRSYKLYGAYVAVLAVVSAIGMGTRGGFYKEYNRLVESCYYTTCGVPTYTVAGHVIYTILDGNVELTDDQRTMIADWQAEHDRLFPYTPLPDSIGRRDNLVIILCESLESWVVGADVDGRPITPFLNSLVADSTTLYAPNVLTQVGSGRSIDCQLLLDAGCLPMLNSVYSMKYPDNNYPSLIKAMAEEKGARSWLLTCDKPVVWNQEPIARSMGYDAILHRDSWVIDEQVGNPPKLSDGSFMRQSVAKLSSGEIWPVDSSAFLQFVTYSGHNPFRLPDSLKDPDFQPSSEVYPQRFVDYVTMAHYTDAQISRLVGYLKSRPDYDRTVIVITGDHEGLAADRKELLANPASGAIVSPGQYTPFIVVNSPVAGRVDYTVGQIDMYPTLLSLMKLDNYHWKGMGTSILSPLHPRCAVASANGALLPDTVTLDAARRSNLMTARSVSDLLIRHNLLPR